MAGSSDRKPWVVLLCLALLAVGLFVTGAVGAARGSSAGADPTWFGLAPGGGLDTGDLSVTSGSCTVSPRAPTGGGAPGGSVTFTGACSLTVAKVDGFPWSDAVRRARLRAVTGSTLVRLSIQGRTMSTTLNPGESVRLVFPRDGGPLTLGCLAVGECVVALTTDSGP